MSEAETIVIENVDPEIDCGSHPAKRKVGDTVVVSADIFSHGTDLLAADVLYRRKGQNSWKRASMVHLGNDRWSGHFTLDACGLFQFTIEAWRDHYSTWLDRLNRWHAAHEDISQDIRIGARMLRAMSVNAGSSGQSLSEAADRLEKLTGDDAVVFAGSKSVLLLAASFQKRSTTRLEQELEIYVDRTIAGFASWYELFPRSQGTVPGRSGTFADCERRLPDIAAMGFDVIYLPPIHPIGRTGRRGKDGGPSPGPDEPGSPWAIGNEQGGHKSIHSELGTIEDFRHLIIKAKSMNIEIALDIAFQCSPDHPYVKEHPEWFYHRPDGSIRYAENPPKKYYDIYPLDFENENRKALWEELRSIFEFWIDAGIKTFRVDNPHTKPFSFWKWVIAELRKKHQDVIFLSEAFTKPNVMYELSKIGFSQSYTYFTWKNFNFELEQYFSEISAPGISNFFRPMLFTNTPDILPFVLQTGGRNAFIIRALLAATLSPLWGIYSGYELCENDALPGKEEYRNSEKYEIRTRDWNSPGNIKAYIAKLNEIRRENAALQEFGNIRFHPAGNPNLVCYTRTSVRGDNVLMVVANVNPFEAQETLLRVPLSELGVASPENYRVEDLLSGDVYTWHGENNLVRLVPGEASAHVFKVVQ
ncbi:MAG: alpha-1,4-glucan--maltose-1-phosphate maltosyltransferase [Methanomassiliicoccales archaeon]|nr:alpha-1,4-glucan--maltose-1-phosphate maltosyltransferase [Methanomassiliicoccales archaeon]